MGPRPMSRGGVMLRVDKTANQLLQWGRGL